jgi:uncharacterized protein YecT (DUF1311 family)
VGIGAIGGPLRQAASVKAAAAARNKQWAFIALSLARRRNKTKHAIVRSERQGRRHRRRHDDRIGFGALEENTMIRSLVLALPLVLVAASAADIDCNNAMDQNSMNMCADKDYRAADKKLNDVYGKLMAALDDATKAKLKTAQRAWIQHRDTECTFETAENEGGSIHPLVYAGCLTRLTDARTKKLQSYFTCWKNADKCGQ